MSRCAEGVCHPRCVVPPSPLSAPQVTDPARSSPAQSSPTRLLLHRRSLPSQPSLAAAAEPLLLSPSVGQQPQPGGKAQGAAGSIASSPGTASALTAVPSMVSEGALETPAWASEEHSFIMNDNSQLAEASLHHAWMLPTTSKAQVPISSQ